MTLRPLLPADVAAAYDVQIGALADLAVRTHEPVRDITPEVRQRGELRIAHLQDTDPDGAWVWEQDGALTGVALALRRGPLWFLSLLMVAPEAQSAGAGGTLLRASLQTCGELGLILASSDPRALRGYQRAGFDLHPAFCARGPVDRSLLPSVPGVRAGSYDTDADLVEDVAVAQRGAPLGPDLGYYRRVGAPLLVVDDAGGRGYVVLRPGGVTNLAATTEDAARRLLWSAFAEAGPDCEVDWMTAEQQWALDVCLDARLPLLPGPSSCLRGRPGPLSPYLPGGWFG